MTLAMVMQASLGALAGAALAVVFLRGLAAATRLTLEGDIRRALPLHALRLGGVAGAFTLAVLAGGAAALLGMLAGFHIAKNVVTRRVP